MRAGGTPRKPRTVESTSKHCLIYMIVGYALALFWHIGNVLAYQVEGTGFDSRLGYSARMMRLNDTKQFRESLFMFWNECCCEWSCAFCQYGFIGWEVRDAGMS